MVEAAPGTPLSPGSPSRPDTSASPEVAVEAVAVAAVEVAEARSYRSELAIRLLLSNFALARTNPPEPSSNVRSRLPALK